MGIRQGGLMHRQRMHRCREMRCKIFTQQAEHTAGRGLQNIQQSTRACSPGARAEKVSGRKPCGNPKGRADTLYSSQGDPWVHQASRLCTCAGNCGKHPGLTLIHRPPLACDPLPQDGYTAPALVQQAPFLGGGSLWGGQDALLPESMQLFAEMCGCYLGPRTGSVG